VPIITPPAFLQAGSYSARLDRLYNNTAPSWADMNSLIITARQGFYSGHVPAYTNGAGMDVVVGPCMGLIRNTFVSASGDYKFANDSNITFTPAASSPTLNRYDILGFRVRDNFYDALGFNEIIPVVIQGANSAGVPTDPALPNAFIPVLRAVVNAAATAPILQSLIVRTSNDGSVLPIGSLAERNLIINPWLGARITRTDMGWDETWDGTAWRTENFVLTAASANVTNPRVGQIIILTTNGIAYRWSGSTWDAVALMDVPPSGTWRQNASFPIPATTDTKLTWDTVARTAAGGIVYSAGNFTLPKIGKYDFHVAVRYNVAQALYLWVAPSASSLGARGKMSTPSGSLNLSMSASVDVLVPNEQWSVYAWAGGATNLVRENSSTDDWPPYVSIKYTGTL